jgi:hypothetical protein
MADGILYALEAMGLNLHGSELIVLSACDTAKARLTIQRASTGCRGLSRCRCQQYPDDAVALYDTRAQFWGLRIVASMMTARPMR